MSGAENQRFRISKTVSTAAMGDGSVLIDRTTGECFELNRTGARIWECLARGEELEGVIDAIASESSIARSVVAADTARLMNALARRGIIVADR
jgi:hypothetical protein